MKNNWMTKLAMSFETPADGGGGGTATATPAPGASSTPAAAASGGADFSFFSGIGLRDLTPKPDVDLNAAPETHAETPVETETPAAETPDSETPTAQTPDELAAAAAKEGRIFSALDDDGNPIEFFKTKEEAEKFLKDREAAPEAVDFDDETPFATPIFKRFNNRKETEAAFGRQESELVRLSKENKDLKSSVKLEVEKHLVTRDAELASLKAELEIARKTPPIHILSEEQEDALGKESPAKLARYLLAKDKHEQGIQKVKDDAAKAVLDRQARNEATAAAIQRQEVEMRTDTKKWPGYERIEPKMVAIHEMLAKNDSPVNRRVLYYFAAQGAEHVALLNKAAEVKKTETTHVKKLAASGAQATGGAGAGGKGAAKSVKSDPNKAWNEAIDAAGGKKVLSFAD